MTKQALSAVFIILVLLTAEGISYSAAKARLPKTGQTATYGTGDDGTFQKGIAWPSPRFTDNGNGTVTDNLTGLIWLQNANCKDTVGGVVKGSGDLAWNDALTWSNNLASGTCGLTDGSGAGDWRLPSRRELKSLIDYSISNPALPAGHPFLNAQSNHSYYWSSTTYVHDTAYAWSVSLYDGAVSDNVKTNSYYVWPVRGGQ